MKKILTTLVLVLPIIGLTQSCPEIGDDQTLQCGVLSTTLTADLSSCVGGSSPKQTTSYSVNPIPYVAQVNTGTSLFMSDDSQQGPFNIGFSFCFYGSSYTQFYVGSNGWISFSGGQPTTFTSSPIPSTAGNVPKNAIMGPWQDWHPGLGGQIRYQVQGTAPCRKLVVSWINVPMFSCSSNQGNFSIVLYESTNVIENHIQNKPSCLNWQGGTAVQGLHNAAGTLSSTVPGRNSTAWVANNEAYRWTPNGPDVAPLYVWYQVGNAVPIGYGLTQTVTPPAGGAEYTCHVQWPSCNSGWNVCNSNSIANSYDTVLIIPGIAPIISPIEYEDTLCVNSSNEMYYIADLGTDVNYYWEFLDTPLNIDNDTVIIDWSGISSGLYDSALVVWAINQDGCSSDTSVVDITVYEETLQIDLIPTLCSSDELYNLTATPPGGIFTGPGVNNQNQFDPSIGISPNTVLYTYEQSGCIFDISTSVTVQQQPIIFDILPGDLVYEICEGSDIEVTFNVIANIPGYTEWFADGLLVQEGTSQYSVYWDTPSTYQISSTHIAGGCVSDTVSIDVTVIPCPELLYYIPNSFTPNSDEFNNTFKPVFTRGIDPYDFNIKVYNRWGEIMWESYTPNEEWDGTYGNKVCMPGTYNVIVIFGDSNNGKTYQLTSHLNILK